MAFVSTCVFLRDILPDPFTSILLEPVEYANSGTLWIVDFSREVMASTAFTVGILVLPVLFRMNHLPQGSFVLLLYPLFNFAVDGSGMASSFSPNVVLGLTLLMRRHDALPSSQWFLASMLGGLCGGRIMNNCFPDQEEEPPKHKKR